MTKSKLYDATLFSFEWPEYENRARQSVDAVFAKYRSDLQTALEKSFSAVMESNMIETGAAQRKIASDPRYMNTLKPRYREEIRKLSPGQAVTNISSPRSVDPLKNVLLDYDVFFGFCAEDGLSEIMKLDKPPLFEENIQLYNDMLSFGVAELKLEKNYVPFEKLPAFQVVAQARSFLKIGVNKHACMRAVRHPLFYITMNSDDPTVRQLLDDIEDSLLNNGYPDDSYKSWIREKIPDSIELGDMNKKLKQRRSQQERERVVIRSKGASYSLENYQFTGPNGSTLIDSALTAMEVLKEELKQSPPLYAPLEEILGAVGENAEDTAGFIKFGEKYWPGTWTVSRLGSLGTLEEVAKFYDELKEKHDTFKGGYSYSAKSSKGILEDIGRLWNYSKNRTQAERRVEELRGQVERELRPGPSYRLIVVEDREGKIIHNRIVITPLIDHVDKARRQQESEMIVEREAR